MLRKLVFVALVVSVTNLVQANYVWDKQNKLWKWVENTKPDKAKPQKQTNGGNNSDLDLENASVQVFNELSNSKKNSRKTVKNSGKKKNRTVLKNDRGCRYSIYIRRNQRFNLTAPLFFVDTFVLRELGQLTLSLSAICCVGCQD